MKILFIILSSITVMMLLSQMICGLWLKTQ